MRCHGHSRKSRLRRRYGHSSRSYVALIEANPGDIMASPDPRVRAVKTRGGLVRLTSESRSALMGVLTNFVGLPRDEAEAYIEGMS
jgi:hypothetical protein